MSSRSPARINGMAACLKTTGIRCSMHVFNASTASHLSFSTNLAVRWADLYGGPLWQISQKVARPVGRHFLKFGGDFHRLTGTRNNPEVPSFFYSGLDALLSNTPSTVSATLGNGDFTMRTFEFGFFIQDDWRATSKLTLNLGIRYDFYSNFVSKGKRGTPDAGLYNPE